MGDVRIIPATGGDHIAHARSLMIEYRDSISTPLCFQGFDAEMATLPGRYAPPSGSLLLAVDGAMPAGCVALREIPAGPLGPTCEMKRLFVRPTHRGIGLGRRLADAIIAEGRRLGYRAMRLDTDRAMAAAQGLYESLGFRRIEKYNDDPIPDTLFFELRL
jgi:ribosomal protein S18 acetylase RimI-like enzyme